MARGLASFCRCFSRVRVFEQVDAALRLEEPVAVDLDCLRVCYEMDLDLTAHSFDDVCVSLCSEIRSEKVILFILCVCAMGLSLHEAHPPTLAETHSTSYY